MVNYGIALQFYFFVRQINPSELTLSFAKAKPGIDKFILYFDFITFCEAKCNEPLTRLPVGNRINN